MVSYSFLFSSCCIQQHVDKGWSRFFLNPRIPPELDKSQHEVTMFLPRFMQLR